MAEDDIYHSKAKYQHFMNNLDSLLLVPSARKRSRGKAGKYYCKNMSNLQYFKRLSFHFEAKDVSYVHRYRQLQGMRLICDLAFKDLAECTRDDINQMVAAMHNIYHTPKSKETFIKDLKYFWKILFPEKDEKGRPDETMMPYVVRHLSAKSDKSREKLRKDKLTWDEIERLVNYFSADTRIQAYLALSLESLARPQELLYVRIGNVELYDNYARIYISEHGKEGVGLLQCIDSYPYLIKWLDVHPLKKNKEAFLFINTGDTNRCKQLRPQNINKLIRKACKDLGIDKPITCYSLKRNGVTIRRLRGESDMEIQHAARWTSTKQLKTYDLSDQDEAFKRELQKRGLIPAQNAQMITVRKCTYCDRPSGFGEIICQQCKRPLDRSAIVEEEKQRYREIDSLRKEFAEQIATIKQQLVHELAKEIIQIKNGGYPRENNLSHQSSRRVSDRETFSVSPLKDNAN